MSKRNTSKLPEHIADKIKKSTLEPDAPSYTEIYSDSGAFDSMGFDNSFDFTEFLKNFRINILSMNEEEMIFDMIGVDAPIANAFRRIMISEVPTVSIDKVLIHNNTSIIPDEVLSHRLGLIPIKVDPSLFQEKNHDAPVDQSKPTDTVKFRLKVSCKKDPHNRSKYINESVYSSHLEWDPFPEQKSKFPNSIRPVEENILIAKLRPGQEIEAELYCEKGIGATHAKWSPVATAWYRLMPEISFKEDVLDEDAETLVKKCPMNVFDIEDLGDGSKKAIAARPRDCTICRECLRDGWDQKVRLQRVKDHYIFCIQTTGILSPEKIFQESCRVFKEKCTTILKHLHQNKLF